MRLPLRCADRAVERYRADVFALYLTTKNFPLARQWIGHISRTQRLLDNDADYVDALAMLAELREDNTMLTARLRQAHFVCEAHLDVATASAIEVWIDEAERRSWFLFEATRKPR